MKILIVNDDGLYSKGMIHLEQELSQYFEVYAICPDRERSATSQAITIRNTIRVQKVSKNHFRINGFPVDCVNIGLHGKLIPEIDLVVSGINHGPNLGDDIHYSGTVGAARHAIIHNKKGIAISYENSYQEDFQRVARWFRIWLMENMDRLSSEVIYNINYPSEDILDVEFPFPEVEYTFQGKRLYQDSYEIQEEKDQQWTLKLKETILGKEMPIGSDFYAIQNKKISITPLQLNTTAWKELQRWKSYVQSR